MKSINVEADLAPFRASNHAACGGFEVGRCLYSELVTHHLLGNIGRESKGVASFCGEARDLRCLADRGN